MRDELIKKVESAIGEGGATAIWSYPCPQGYRYQILGNPTRKLEDFEGLALVRLPEKMRGDSESGRIN